MRECHQMAVDCKARLDDPLQIGRADPHRQARRIGDHLGRTGGQGRVATVIGIAGFDLVREVLAQLLDIFRRVFRGVICG